MVQPLLYSIKHKKISLLFLIFLTIGSLVETLPAASLLTDSFGTIESHDVNGEVGVIGIDWGIGMSRTPGANIEIYRQDLAGNETWIGYGFLRNSNLMEFVHTIPEMSNASMASAIPATAAVGYDSSHCLYGKLVNF